MSNETPPFRDHPAVRAVIGFGRVPDAVDAAIERHRAARDELQRASNGVDAASDADGAAWADLLATRPGDVPGAVRLLRYVSGSPASEVVDDPQDLLRQLLAAVEAGETGARQGEGAQADGEASAAGEPNPVPAEPTEEPVDWYAPPPGFMASPAIEPFGFALIPEGIAIELGRLRGIALAEFERRSAAGMTPEGEERLRRDLHLDALSKAAGGQGGFAVWPTPGAEATSVRDWQAEAALHPGFVPFPAHAPRILMDLEGAIRGEARWLLGLAEAEIARRRAAYDGFHDPSVWPQVERDLRREMRMDALAVAAGSLPADDGAADPQLRALVMSWEAAERAGNAPGLSDDERAPLIDHASSLLRGLYAFPARTMADICAKLPAFRDEAANTGDAPDAPDTEVTLEACALRAIVADLERLAAARATGAVGKRPEASSRLEVEDLDAAALVSVIEAEWSTWASLDGRERDEAGDRAFDASIARRDALLDAAEALPASSREARHAKALARAWMDWVEDGRPNEPRGAYDFDGRLVFDIHASFMACERPAAASSEAETLVERILVTWAALASAEDASDDAASEVLLDQRAALLREAERLPATRPHLVAKALAFAWIGHAHLWRVGQAREDYAIDGRLALDIEATARRPSAMEG